MEIKGSVGLVTGGNRGIGEAFVRVLLEFGADLNLKGFGKDSPLHDAARNGHLKVN